MTSTVAAPRRLIVDPAHLSLPRRRLRTLGPIVADVCASAGFPPDPEQEQILDARFAEEDDGRPAIFETVVIGPRQNIKTGSMKQIAIGDLYVVDARKVVYSAHEWNPAVKDMHADMSGLIENSPFLMKRTRKIFDAHGDESILLRSGAQMLFKTRVKLPGVGMTADKLLMDEAFALRFSHMGALVPTLSTRSNAQIVYGSSAAHADSEVLHELIARGHGGCVCDVCDAERREKGLELEVDPDLALFEWCAPPPAIACDLGRDCDHNRRTRGCGCDKPEMIRIANPQYGRRIPSSFFPKERRTMSGEKYGREIMGWHDALIPPDLGEPPAVNLDKWHELELDVDDQADLDLIPDELPSYGVEVSRDREWSSIGAAGRCVDGRVFVELAYRERGTDWVLATCEAIDKDHGPAVFAVDGGGPAKTLIKPMREAGLNVTVMGTNDVMLSCAGMVDGINDAEVIHGPDEVLDESFACARKRLIGGDGGFSFGRNKSEGDVTSALSVTHARWLLLDLDYDLEDSIF